MSRLLAIVAVVMLLGGAVVGLLALGPAHPGWRRGLLSVSLNKPLRDGAAPHASDDPALPPLYDVPKLDKIKLDGSGRSWGERGLRVNLLANAGGKIQPSSDIDASVRLGWDDHGLLVLATEIGR